MVCEYRWTYHSNLSRDMTKRKSAANHRGGRHFLRGQITPMLDTASDWSVLEP